MESKAPRPKFVVDESGKKSAVLLGLSDYARLLTAWEEIADSEDFASARGSAKKFIGTEELRQRVLKKSE